MPAWLEPPMTLVTVVAVFFFLAWLVGRDRLSPTVKLWGWVSVILTLASFLWSLWVETLAPAIRSGNLMKVARTASQIVIAVGGIALALAGTVRFLQVWASTTGWTPATPIWEFLDSPAFREIRQQPTAADRWREALALIVRVLLLPGLGWVPLGVGLTILAFQLLEPDPTLQPDPTVVKVGIGFTALGLLQIFLRALFGGQKG